MNKTDLEEFVEYLYRQLDIKYPEQMTVAHVAQKLGITVIHSPYTSRALRPGGKLVINLNSSLTPEEQWETFAHELFHILKETGNQANIPILLKEMRENKANNFALHFCIPTFMLDRIKWPERNSIYFISEAFHVTAPFAKKRLSQYECRLFQWELDRYNSMISIN